MIVQWCICMNSQVGDLNPGCSLHGVMFTCFPYTTNFVGWTQGGGVDWVVSQPPSLGLFKLEIWKGNRAITEVLLSRYHFVGQPLPLQKSWIRHCLLDIGRYGMYIMGNNKVAIRQTYSTL